MECSIASPALVVVDAPSVHETVGAAAASAAEVTTASNNSSTLAQQCGVQVHLVSDAAWFSTPAGVAAVAKFRQEITAEVASASANANDSTTSTSLPIMGLDTEWASDTTVAVLQISSCFTQCFVLQLAVAAGYDPTGLYIPGGATAAATSPPMSRHESMEAPHGGSRGAK
jgi:hypothetical protein